ncbi:MAG: hypothetical protein R3C11_15160 [Planctomycetaceae bacterium]
MNWSLILKGGFLGFAGIFAVLNVYFTYLPHGLIKIIQQHEDYHHLLEYAKLFGLFAVLNLAITSVLILIGVGKLSTKQDYELQKQNVTPKAYALASWWNRKLNQITFNNERDGWMTFIVRQLTLFPLIFQLAIAWYLNQEFHQSITNIPSPVGPILFNSIACLPLTLIAQYLAFFKHHDPEMMDSWETSIKRRTAPS